MERADQWGLFIRLVGWWDTTRGRALSLLLDALNLAHIRAINKEIGGYLKWKCISALCF